MTVPIFGFGSLYRLPFPTQPLPFFIHFIIVFSALTTDINDIHPSTDIEEADDTVLVTRSNETPHASPPPSTTLGRTYQPPPQRFQMPNS